MNVTMPTPENDQVGHGASLFGRPRSEVDQALPDREAVECPLCQRAPCPFGVDFQGLQLARCPTCGLEFQHPRPVFDQLAAAVYGQSYHRAEEASADPIRARQFGCQLTRLEQLLPADRRTLLDVGCGAGAFIRFARAREWRVDGTDVVTTDWARQTGAQLWEGQLPDICFEEARFDVVRFNQVLEHTQDPLGELRRARDLVTTGGILLVGVPNLAGLSVRLKSWQSRFHLKVQRWKHYGALHHLWFFTPRTLSKFVDAAMFEVVHWETPVADRPGHPAWVTAAMRASLEAVRAGGILELYARAR